MQDGAVRCSATCTSTTGISSSSSAHRCLLYPTITNIKAIARQRMMVKIFISFSVISTQLEARSGGGSKEVFCCCRFYVCAMPQPLKYFLKIEKTIKEKKIKINLKGKSAGRKKQRKLYVSSHFPVARRPQPPAIVELN